MNAYAISASACHVFSRKLILFKLLWDKSCRGISLVTQELLLIMFLTRYLDLLYIFVNAADEFVKVAHLIVSLATVLIIRYSPAVNETYDADLDTLPRAALIAPPLVLALVFNKVFLIIEILHAFSNYLEALVLIPQFVLLYRRKKYESWVLLVTVLLGAESVMRSMPQLLDWKEQQNTDPYGLGAAFAQVVVYVSGLAALAVRHFETSKQQGLNELPTKPEFGEEWQAGKFEFQGEEAGPVPGAKPKEGGKSAGGGGSGV